MISIIIPIYNAEYYLKECFSSILSQTYSDYEVICVDDGSTDESRKICNDFCAKDSRFRLFSQKNAGVSAARNLGIEMSRGQYICFVDADDYLDSHFFEELLYYIAGHDAVLCDLTRGEGLGQKGVVKEVTPESLICDVIYERIKHPGLYCFLYKTCIIRNYDIRFPVGCVKNEDTEFYLNYLAACINKISMTSYIGYFYRSNPYSVMAAPISIKSLTSIEASRRINKVLYDRGLINDNKIVLCNGILTYAYSIAKQHNSELYDYLHEHYEVKAAMKKMLLFPRFSKKIVAITYLLLGRKLFFEVLGILRLI